MNDNNQPYIIRQGLIDSYFADGLEISELSCSEGRKQQLNTVLRAWNYLKANPWATNDDMRKFFRYTGCPSRQVTPNMICLEYIKNKYSATTRAEAQLMADYAARTALKQAAEAGDRQDLLRAGSLLTKIHQLDKPEQDKEKARLNDLPIVITTRIEDVDPHLVTVEDDKLRSILTRFGAMPDAMEEKIQEKVEEMENDE